MVEWAMAATRGRGTAGDSRYPVGCHGGPRCLERARVLTGAEALEFSRGAVAKPDSYVPVYGTSFRSNRTSATTLR